MCATQLSPISNVNVDAVDVGIVDLDGDSVECGLLDLFGAGPDGAVVLRRWPQQLIPRIHRSVP